MGVSALAAAVATAVVQVAVPAFETDPASTPLAPRLRDAYVTSVSAAGCASVLPLTPEVSQELTACAGRPACLGRVGRRIGAQKLILGRLRRGDDGYRLDLVLVDAARDRLERRIGSHTEGRLSALTEAASKNAALFCDALLAPPPPDEIAQIEDLELAPLVDKTAAPGAAGEGDDFELPDVVSVFDMPDELPPLLPQDPSAGEAAADGSPARRAPSSRVTEIVSLDVPPPAEARPPAPPAPKPFTVALPQLNRRQWGMVAAGAGVVTAVAGAVVGGSSAAIWALDQPTTRDGVVYHSISREDARRANRLAVGANLLFGVAGVLATTGGVLYFLPSPDGTVAVAGRF